MEDKKYITYKFSILKVLLFFSMVMCTLIIIYELSSTPYRKLLLLIMWSFWIYLFFRYKGQKIYLSIKGDNQININNISIIIKDIESITLSGPKNIYYFAKIRLKNGRYFFIDSRYYAYELLNFVDEILKIAKINNIKIVFRQFYIKSNTLNKIIYVCIFLCLFFLVFYVGERFYIKEYFLHIFIMFLITIFIAGGGVLVKDK